LSNANRNGLIFVTVQLSFGVEILAFWAWRLFGLLIEKLGNFFSNLLVTLLGERASLQPLSLSRAFLKQNLPNINSRNWWRL